MSNDFSLTLDIVKRMHACAKSNDLFLHDITQLLLFKEIQVQQALIRAKKAETQIGGVQMNNQTPQ